MRYQRRVSDSRYRRAGEECRSLRQKEAQRYKVEEVACTAWIAKSKGRGIMTANMLETRSKEMRMEDQESLQK